MLSGALTQAATGERMASTSPYASLMSSGKPPEADY
jgi:hypothetical protein